MSAHELRAIFEPASVALIGASDKPGSLGTTVLENLLAAEFRGELLLVNPGHREIRGRTVYRALSEAPSVPDVAVIVTPAAAVPDIVTECGKRGVRGAIVISAGFREVGRAGLELEREVVRRARELRVRFIGPNCLGVIRPDIGFNATFSAGQAEPGRLAVVSQSGALCTAILDWSHDQGVGFSSLISTGISADVGFGEILDYLATDPRTESILLYVEGVHDARRFVSGLRAAARVKPVVVMKVGRHAEGSRAALSHTGALVGSDAIFDAALRRAGVLRVLDFADFFSTATVLDTGLRTAGNRLAIVTNAGGPGVLAADHCADRGVVLAALSLPTVAALDAGLPAAWSHGNPIDVLGDARPERYRTAVQAALADPGVDGVLVLFTPQALAAPDEAAECVIELAAGAAKPVLTCWMGGSSVLRSRARFSRSNLPTFGTPESAVAAFARLAAYHDSQEQLLQVPEPSGLLEPPDVESARTIVATTLAEDRAVLTLAESKAVLAAFRVPIVQSIPARTLNDAVLIAQEIGFPVALKIDSPDITHKSDVGGVALGLADAEAVRDAHRRVLEAAARAAPDAHVTGVLVEPMWRGEGGRELMVGMTTDPVFGPTISFGLGGTLVEVVRDRSVALPPLNRPLIRSLIATTRAAAWLGEFRGLPAVAMPALEDLLLRVSEMACELPALQELDINPVIASAAGVVAVDARLVVKRTNPSARPYEHMAIHPYPVRLVTRVVLPDGTPVTIRPIRPEDAVIERDFVNALSERSKYLRFMYLMQKITPAMLSRFTQIDYDRDMALIAVVDAGGAERQVGVARYATLPDEAACEFAVVVADDWQGRGLGAKLVTLLLDCARARRFDRMVGSVLRENHRMLAFCRSLGFEVTPDPEDRDLMKVSLSLGG